MKRLFDLACLTVVMVFMAGSGRAQTVPVSMKDAIGLAEQFIKDNGYTDAPADTTKLSFELFDDHYKTVEELLQYRYNILHKQAFCVSKNDDEWHIGFLSRKVDLKTLDLNRKSDLPGRAVIVQMNGNELRMAHKTPLFSKFTKL